MMTCPSDRSDGDTADDPPFWKVTRMQGESLLFVRPGRGEPAQAQLLFTPLAPPRLSSAMGLEAYEAGVDYLWTPGTRTLTVPAASRVRALCEDELYPPRGSQKHGTCRDREADLLFGEGAFFHRLQSVATYDHSLDGWTTPATLREPVRWPGLAERATRRERLSMVLLGDSIAVGHNASGLSGVPPKQGGFGPLVAAGMRHWFGTPVDLVNLSVGGMGSEWGVKQMDAVMAVKPDLLLLAFGMNDASAGVAAGQLLAHIEAMVRRLGAEAPQARSLVITPMSGHPQWTGTVAAAYGAYRDALLVLREEDVAIADVTTVWQEVVRRKKDLDLSGNGLNHPNDFGHRLYAQVIGHVLRQALMSTAG